ncbi:mitochondrial protein C2orf69 homolog [Pectinophora gossypiella]|uniref:mitochondrial protein C2orf69 homolog n=1 Tax=Pectinophora gossypiella TaxID=13191 RepID=UPI00214E3A0A|nr:mitochondrial protein C2orf69 homolog [Pectinophora gossypiella]XP_049870548.1 mitochondrial protein C2orf69 homolog [Pectinophora gossypiella]
MQILQRTTTDLLRKLKHRIVCRGDSTKGFSINSHVAPGAGVSGGAGAMLPLRLRRVAGLEGRLNDVLFTPAARAPAPLTSPQTLVFFGGDVQDYPEVMQAHRDNRNYLKWNLESTARLLSHNFPSKHILVVRPSRIEYKSFSCYDNFVPSNNAGVPDHTPTHSALHHLEKLLQGVTSRLKSLPSAELLEAVSSVSLPEEIDIEDLHTATAKMATEPSHSNGATKTDEHKPEMDPLWWREGLALDCSALTLVGFSKGCVVLNQAIYEFHYTKTLTPGDAHMMRFMERIEEMYWLDGGHAGGKNTWITSRSLLETLTRLNVNIYIHVSPYQVQDEGRPWIGREEKAFTALLRKLGAKVQRYLHSEVGAPHNLHMHFDVLGNFKRLQDSAPALLPESSDDEN